MRARCFPSSICLRSLPEPGGGQCHFRCWHSFLSRAGYRDPGLCTMVARRHRQNATCAGAAHFQADRLVENGYVASERRMCYNAYRSYISEIAMRSTRSMVISMRLPAESGKRLKRMAHRHGWTPSDASARLVEEGLRRSEFGFIDFRDSPCGPASLPSREHARGMGGHAARPQLSERCVVRGETSQVVRSEGPGSGQLCGGVSRRNQRGNG